MTYTTNYSLHKPSTTDNFNISDFNANSDIIDKQFGITSANIPKVTCSTSASTVAKTATINGTFVLNRGARVLVVLSTANTVASATFNLNSTGAKPILVNGASVTTSNLTAQTYLAEFDGTNWRFTTSTYTSDYARASNSASSATSATSVVDYGDTSKTIKIGYTGAGATVSNLSYIAGYLTGGTQIKDVSKSVLQSWLDLSNYLPLTGGTVTGATQFNNYVKLNAWDGYGTGTANFWYDGNNKFVEIQNANTLKLAGVNVSKEGHKHSASDITSGVLPVANGGTGQTTAKGAEYNIIGGVETVDRDLTDSRYFALRNETVSSDNGSFRWNKVSKIKKYTESNYWYGTCSTASATVAKTVSITDFSLTKNVRVTIKFTNANTATNATLNINSTGAKPIYYKGTNVGNNIIDAKSTVNLVYNGTQYEIIGDFTPTTTSTVTGVKGEAEDSYRDGNVNITKSDLGLTTDTLGIEWYDSNMTNSYYNAPYYANGIWVIGSNNNDGIKYSTDGKTWSNSNITSGNFNAPYYANGIWVIGSNSNSGSGSGIKYSIDGKTWSNSNITSGSFDAPYYANGIWVISCNADTTITSSDVGGIKYSTDGKTWRDSNITGFFYNAPYYANGIWVIGSNSNSGSGSGSGIKYSTDGKTWSNSNITSNSYNAPYYANGIWVIGSNSNGGIKYSTDGKTWSNSNITSGNFNAPYYANGIWVIGSNSNGGIKYSTDGKTWSNSNFGGSFGAPYYANGIWVIGSTASSSGTSTDTGIKYSTDGKTWRDSNITGFFYNAPYYANGIWVMSNDDGGQGIKYSTFNSLNDLASTFKGVSELKSYVDDTFATKSYVDDTFATKSYVDDTFATKSYVTNHMLYL